MHKEISACLNRYGIAYDEPIVVGCSGGPDSVYLFLALASLHSAKHLYVAHANHGLRGKDSDDDEVFVETLSQKYGCPYIGAKLDVQSHATQHKQGIEEAARELRYNFLREVKTRVGARYIWLAHHMDDQAETILLRIVQGARLGGISGMQEQNNGILRPLLSMQKADIQKYLDENNQPYRTDKSNTDIKFLRNKLRENIFPQLKTINPSIAQTLAGLGSYAQELQAYIDTVVENAVGGNSFSVHTFAQLAPVLQREAVRYLYTKANGASYGLSEGMVEEGVRYILTANGATTKVFGRLCLRKKSKIISVEY